MGVFVYVEFVDLYMYVCKCMCVVLVAVFVMADFVSNYKNNFYSLFSLVHV